MASVTPRCYLLVECHKDEEGNSRPARVSKAGTGSMRSPVLQGKKGQKSSWIFVQSFITSIEIYKIMKGKGMINTIQLYSKLIELPCMRTKNETSN